MKQSLRLLVGVLLAVATTHAGGGQFGSTTTEPAVTLAETTVFSRSLRFEGKVVEQMADGKAVREVAFMRGRKFVWQGYLGDRVAAPERLVDDGGRTPPIEQMTRDELAGQLRGLALFNGHQFQEAEPAYDLADEVIRLRERELQQPSEKPLPRGKTASTRERPLHPGTGSHGGRGGRHRFNRSPRTSCMAPMIARS